MGSGGLHGPVGRWQKYIPGYDATRQAQDGLQRIQIRGRAYGDDAKPGQRISRIKTDAACDTVLLVTLDNETRDVREMWEVPFTAVAARLPVPGSKSRDRGALGASEFRRMILHGVTAMAFNSLDSYHDFARAVRREFRYARTPEQEEFLRTVVATSHSRSLTMKAGYVLWRAQLGHDWRVQQQGDESFEIETSYPPARMKPLAERASNGRANSKGIACLYLATQKEMAVLEVRPHIGSYVSIAQFQVLKNLRLVDCSAK